MTRPMVCLPALPFDRQHQTVHLCPACMPTNDCCVGIHTWASDVHVHQCACKSIRLPCEDTYMHLVYTHKHAMSPMAIWWGYGVTAKPRCLPEHQTASGLRLSNNCNFAAGQANYSTKQPTCTSMAGNPPLSNTKVVYVFCRVVLAPTKMRSYTAVWMRSWRKRKQQSRVCLHSCGRGQPAWRGTCCKGP